MIKNSKLCLSESVTMQTGFGQYKSNRSLWKVPTIHRNKRVCACVCVSACVCESVCVHACVCECVCVSVSMCVCAFL